MTETEPDTPSETEASEEHPRRLFWGLKPRRWLMYRSTWLAILPILKGPIRLRGFGHQEVPRRGPLLLLPNHHTFLDPFMVGWLPFRPSHFMASAQPLKTPVLGRWLRSLGAFPKNKFVKDRASMEELQRIYDDGHLVTIFPEGTRSWNGRTQKLGGGIGRLVTRMDAGVVIARLVSAHYFWPRWARYPRYVPVHIEYEGPLYWPEGTNPEQITAEIQELLTCEQRIPEGARTFGVRMAHGLPAYLWACPSCFAEGGLHIHRRNGNKLVCVACRAQWRLHVDTRLEALREHESFSVAEAYDRIVDRFGHRPVVDQARFDAEGVALEASSGEMIRALKQRRGFESVAQGRLRLTGEGIEVGARDPWLLPYADIVAVSVELGNKVQLRTADDLYRLSPSEGSVLKWGHFVHEWRCSVQGLPRSPLG